MLKTTYFNIYKGWGENPYLVGAEYEIVMRNTGHLLSPSFELINEFKSNKITWKQFSIRFKEEMNNEECINEMKRIKKISKERDFYLVCSCFNKKNECHRFILLEIINNLKED